MKALKIRLITAFLFGIAILAGCAQEVPSSSGLGLTLATPTTLFKLFAMAISSSSSAGQQDRRDLRKRNVRNQGDSGIDGTDLRQEIGYDHNAGLFRCRSNIGERGSGRVRSSRSFSLGAWRLGLRRRGDC